MWSWLPRLHQQFSGVQEMLVFVVAMVCIIHIPHLLESPARGAAARDCRLTHARAPEKSRRRGCSVQPQAVIIFSSKNMFEMLGLPQGLASFNGRRLVPTPDEATAACSKTSVCKPEELGSTPLHCTQKVLKGAVWCGALSWQKVYQLPLQP